MAPAVARHGSFSAPRKAGWRKRASHHWNLSPEGALENPLRSVAIWLLLEHRVTIAMAHQMSVEWKSSDDTTMHGTENLSLIQVQQRLRCDLDLRLSSPGTERCWRSVLRALINQSTALAQCSVPPSTEKAIGLSQASSNELGPKDSIDSAKELLGLSSTL